MTTEDAVKTVRAWIADGTLDAHLTTLQSDISERRMRTREFIEWVAGDRVRLNERCRPKYLQGSEATVTNVLRTRVMIRLDKDCGRFSSTRDIKVPTELLDKVV